MAGVSIRNLTRQHQKILAGAVFLKVANDVLPDWDISLVFVGSKKALDLNKQLRGKDYTPNILSYAVGEKSGEIFICPSEASKQASDFHLTPYNFHLYLFIHGLLHLKGMAHGGTMERCEKRLLEKYVAKDNHRH